MCSRLSSWLTADAHEHKPEVMLTSPAWHSTKILKHAAITLKYTFFSLIQLPNLTISKLANRGQLANA